ncbi:hypothetical protein LINPERHAP2_LOCUS30414 [Linum perenne]
MTQAPILNSNLHSSPTIHTLRCVNVGRSSFHITSFFWANPKFEGYKRGEKEKTWGILGGFPLLLLLIGSLCLLPLLLLLTSPPIKKNNTKEMRGSREKTKSNTKEMKVS